jgi:putative endonuclease
MKKLRIILTLFLHTSAINFQMKKTAHLILGKKGEDAAGRFLWSKGYEILAVNWRFRRCEVDIVAQKDNELVFIEVKTRKDKSFGLPEEFVDKSKLLRMLEASEAFIQENGLSALSLRFDIIAIVKNAQTLEIEHLENVFFPDWM